jgi:hypothetical protein
MCGAEEPFQRSTGLPVAITERPPAPDLQVPDIHAQSEYVSSVRGSTIPIVSTVTIQGHVTPACRYVQVTAYRWGRRVDALTHSFGPAALTWVLYQYTHHACKMCRSSAHPAASHWDASRPCTKAVPCARPAITAPSHCSTATTRC